MKKRKPSGASVAAGKNMRRRSAKEYVHRQPMRSVPVIFLIEYGGAVSESAARVLSS